MEFLLELLFDIILEGTLELGANRRVPFVFRILALFVIVALFGGITILIFFAGYHVLKEDNAAAGVFLIVTGVLMTLGSIYMVVKKLRQH